METCPPEITHIIAKHLTKHALLHCLRVSKSWSDIFIPFVWRNFHAQKPRQLRAIGTPEFSAAVLRHGRHINSLHLGSYRHLKPFLQELPPPLSPSKAPLDDKYTANTRAYIPCYCVQNLHKFELSIRRTKRDRATKHIDLLLNPSTSPTPIFALSLDVSLDDPPLVLWLLKNNPHLLSLEFGGYNFELEWFLKLDRLLIGSSSSSSSSSCTPLSSLTQLMPNLKDLTLHSYYTPYGKLFRCQVEPLARFLFQVPETIETLTLSGRLEDVTEQTTPSTSTPSSHPVDDTASPTKCTNPTNIDEHLPTHPLAVQKLSLELFTLSEDNPQHKNFLQSLGSLLRRCVRLKELSLGIPNVKHQDAAVSHFVNYLVEAKMLTTLSVEGTLPDRDLARLLDRTRLVKEGVNTNTNLVDAARLRGDEQDWQEQGKEDGQCGWRAIKLHSYTTLGPLSSAALAAQFPTLKSLDVVKCHSCPSQVLATLLTSSRGLETLTTIRDRKGGSDDYEYSYNFIDARHLSEMDPTTSNGNTGQAATGWACTGLRTLKAVITNKIGRAHV